MFKKKQSIPEKEKTRKTKNGLQGILEAVFAISGIKSAEIIQFPALQRQF